MSRPDYEILTTFPGILESIIPLFPYSVHTLSNSPQSVSFTLPEEATAISSISCNCDLNPLSWILCWFSRGVSTLHSEGLRRELAVNQLIELNSSSCFHAETLGWVPETVC